MAGKSMFGNVNEVREENKEMAKFLLENSEFENLLKADWKKIPHFTTTEQSNVSMEEVAKRLVQAPMTSNKVLKQHVYLPKKGYEVINIPYYLWNAAYSTNLQKPFLRCLLRGRGINL